MDKKIAPRIRMRTTLLLSMLAISFGLTLLSLLMIRTSLRSQIQTQLQDDLNRSAATFQNLRTQRRQMLEHEADLLADLPSLRALMTSDDQHTIADAAPRFAQRSGDPFFALLSRSGQIMARYEEGRLLESPSDTLDAQIVLNRPTDPHYLSSGKRLYELALRPLYFGSADQGTLLGYVVVGYEIDNKVAKEVSDAAAADVVFAADSKIVASTLDDSHVVMFQNRTLHHGQQNSDIWLGKQHYLAASFRLSAPGAAEVKLTVLKSFDEANRYQRRLNRLLLLAGFLVLLLGIILATYVSRTITQPLEELVAGVRALGRGDYRYPLGSGGALELQELRATFGSVRERLQKAQQELVEAERLATIGSMASSISHDLRHYLSAVYANAEFLGYATTKQEERAELLAEVRMGVQGMTELIESLLIFSRTGRAIQLTYESLPVVAERSIALLRTHPDANSVAILLEPGAWIECWIDAKKIERAIYNLLLNACHAAKFGAEVPRVSMRLDEDSEWITVWVEDNGAGVEPSVKVTMFQPFVSQGKHGGSGLGLTLTSRIAQEHGGHVTLEESGFGRTIFKLAIAKSKLNSLHETQMKQALKPTSENAAPASQNQGRDR